MTQAPTQRDRQELGSGCPQVLRLILIVIGVVGGLVAGLLRDQGQHVGHLGARVPVRRSSDVACSLILLESRDTTIIVRTLIFVTSASLLLFLLVILCLPQLVAKYILRGRTLDELDAALMPIQGWNGGIRHAEAAKTVLNH